MAFDSLQLVRFIDDGKNGVNQNDVSLVSRQLEITVSDAQQIFPKVQGNPAANLLLLAAGTIRFGQDGDNPLEDDTNEFNEDAEVDFRSDNPFEPKSRTVWLMLVDITNHPEDEFLVKAEEGKIVRSASLAALANGGLTTDDDGWRVAMENASVRIMSATRPDGSLVTDLSLLSDVSARGEDVDFGQRLTPRGQLNRSGFQVAVLAHRPVG
jgi:hypothetical protein